MAGQRLAGGTCPAFGGGAHEPRVIQPALGQGRVCRIENSLGRDGG